MPGSQRLSRSHGTDLPPVLDAILYTSRSGLPAPRWSQTLAACCWGHRGPSALLNSGAEPATQPPQPEGSLEEAAGKRRRNKPVQAWRARCIRLDNIAHKRRKSCLKIEQLGFIISMGFRSSHAQKHSSVISSGGVSWLCAMWSYVMSVISAPSQLKYGNALIDLAIEFWCFHRAWV